MGGVRGDTILPTPSIRWLTASDPAVANRDEYCAPNLEVKERGVGRMVAGKEGGGMVGGLGRIKGGKREVGLGGEGREGSRKEIGGKR